MFEYKTEVLKTGVKWLTDKAHEADVTELNNLITERASEGWELVTYSYMAVTLQIKGATLITFKRQK
ncbi:MAG: DUF4177 domain-containing protein [Coriobacteriales bacterium]|jgi:hypothetical protein|nr:DUF4177 domain-containing protein [Coriobacteriales bacterium]